MQMEDLAMTRLDDGTLVTDRNADLINEQLLAAGYSVRHIETWHAHERASFVVWDTPALTEADLPY